MKKEKYKIDIVQSIIDNFDDISKDSYTWKSEEIEAVYLLTDKVLNSYKDVDEHDKDDIKQITIERFFSYIVKNIKVCDKRMMLGYICTSIKNEANRYLKDKNKEEIETLYINDYGEYSIDDYISNGELFGEERYYNQSLKEYKSFLKKTIESFPFLKGYYFENKKQRELAEEFDMTKANVSVRLNKERDTLKILLMENNYTSDFFEICCNVKDPFKICNTDKNYKDMERLVSKHGLVKLVDYYKYSIKEVAESLKMEEAAIRYALKYLQIKNKTVKRK